LRTPLAIYSHGLFATQNMGRLNVITTPDIIKRTDSLMDRFVLYREKRRFSYFTSLITYRLNSEDFIFRFLASATKNEQIILGSNQLVNGIFESTDQRLLDKSLKNKAVGFSRVHLLVSSNRSISIKEKILAALSANSYYTALDALADSSGFKFFIVKLDDIANIAKEYGAEVFFKRISQGIR